MVEHLESAAHKQALAKWTNPILLGKGPVGLVRSAGVDVLNADCESRLVHVPVATGFLLGLHGSLQLGKDGFERGNDRLEAFRLGPHA